MKKGLDIMPKRLELLQQLIDNCKAEKVRVLNDSGRTISVEVIINRNQMSDCAKALLELGWDAGVMGIEKINKGDAAWTETGDGLYRYTLQFDKFD